MKKTEAPKGAIKFDFLKIAPYFTLGSGLVVLISLILIFTKGFNFGIDFAGGTEVQVHFQQKVEAGKVRKTVEDLGFANASVQTIGTENEYLIRMEQVAGANDNESSKILAERIAKITEGLKTTFAAETVEIRRVDSVGPQVGSELQKNAALALFYSLIVMLIYIGLRFDFFFAQGAVICLFHDAIITLGVYSLLNWEVNAQTLAAILTIIGYSINDTIVTFDRIRENLPEYRDQSFGWVVNLSVNETLRRTILTSCTTFLAVTALCIFATGAIQSFALTMLVGVIIGCYSTVYVASPLVIYAHNINDRLKASKAKAA